MTLFFLLAFAQPTVTLVGKNLPVDDALNTIHGRTGIRAVLVPLRPGATVHLDLRTASAWSALDAIARQLDAKLDLDRSTIKIVPRRPGELSPPTSYDGPFRFRVTRVQANRDLVAHSASTTLSLEIGWLPTLRPIYLDSTPHGLRVVDLLGKNVPIVEESPTLVPLEEKSSFTLDLVLPPFPRSATHIGTLAGKLHAVVLGDMLTYDFDASLDILAAALTGGAQRRLVRGGVACTVTKVSFGRERWTIKMTLDYPAGANREFESFQAGSMVVANELRLVSADGRRTLVPSASIAEETGPRRTVVSFHFTDGPTGKRGTPAAWKMRYRAPARIIDMPLSFALDKVRLP